MHLSFALHETTVYESSCAPKIRNDRVQGSWNPETNRELRPHFQLHSSAKQTKGCVLETQPVSGFLSAVGLCTTFSLLSVMLNRTSCACPGKSESVPCFNRKNVSPLPFPWDECTVKTAQKALLIIILERLTHTSTNSRGRGIFKQWGETFPPPGALGSTECGRQTGFHTPLLGRVEPLVNSRVVKAEQWLIDWAHLLQPQTGLVGGCNSPVCIRDDRLEWHLLESADKWLG